MSSAQSAVSEWRPGRVLMTADTVGGVFSYAAELARGLSDAGVRVLLATMGPAPSADQRALLRRIPGLELRESSLALEWMDDPWRDVDRAGKWLLELEREFAPDVVHLSGYAHAALGFRAPVMIVAHSCVFSWWAAVLSDRPPERYEEYRRRVARGLACADVVVAPTHAMLSELVRCYGVAVRGKVIANGVRPASADSGTKEDFFLGAGRLWDAAKNLRLLCAAASSLPWPLRLAGECGAERPDERVEILGRLPQTELQRWMARARVFIHPARYEPFGLAPLEAALAGCALILGDIPSLREVWADAALYVDPTETRALVTSAHRLARDRAECERMAERARSRAAAYSAQAMVQGYLESYAELMHGKRSAA